MISRIMLFYLDKNALRISSEDNLAASTDG